MENQDPSAKLKKQISKSSSARLAYRKKRFSFDSAPKRNDSTVLPLENVGDYRKKENRVSLGSYFKAGPDDSRRPCSPTESLSSNFSTMTQSTARGRLTKFIKDKNSKTKVTKSEKARSDSDPLCPKVLRVRIRNILAGCEPISKEEQGAAIKIQCSVRMHLAKRKLFLSSYARMIQATWRGFHQRKSLEEIHEKATEIQSRWRAYYARSSFLYYTGAVQIQRTWRCYHARQKFLNYRKITAAATSIQTAWRSFFAYYSFAFTIHCVTIVQKLYRGRVGRKICKELATRKERRRLLRNSAVTIQRHFRGLVARTRCLDIHHDKWLNECMARFQASWRAYSQQRKFWHIVGAAIQVQSFARGTIRQIRYLDMLWAAVLLQSHIRGFLVRSKFRETYEEYFLNKAAAKIQAAWRASIARKNYKLHEGARTIQRAWRNYCAYCDFQIFTAAQKMQTAWRGYSMRMKYVHTLTAIHAATKIQSSWRSFMRRGDYIFTIIDIITVQRLVRGIEGRKIFKIKAEKRAKQLALENRRHNSALEIQRVFRGHIGRCEFDDAFERKQRCDAATLIQTEWRRYDAEQNLWHKIDCVIQIQSMMRGSIARYQYADRLGGIILVQSIARQWLGIRQLKRHAVVKSIIYDSQKDEFRDRRAAIVLQYFYWDIVKPQYTIKCAIKIQSFFRMVKAMVDVYMLTELKRKEERKEKKLREERLKNRDENIDNLMLEEAWSKSMQSSSKATDKVQEILETIAVPEVAKKSEQQKPKGRTKKHSKDRSHMKQQSRSRNSQRKTKKSIPSSATTCSSIKESMLDDALQETWEQPHQDVKNVLENIQVKETVSNDSSNAQENIQVKETLFNNAPQSIQVKETVSNDYNHSADDQSVTSFTSSIATKTSMKLDQTWEFTYGQSDDLKNLGAESTASVQPIRRSSNQSNSKGRTKKQAKRSRSKDPPEKLPSDSSMKRNAQKDQKVKKISTQVQMINRISSTGAKVEREQSTNNEEKVNAKLLDQTLDELWEVESKDPPARRSKESRRLQPCKVVSTPPTAGKSSILNSEENDALDEAWEVMLVENESRPKQKLDEPGSSEITESSVEPSRRSRSRSTSRSGTRKSQTESPLQQSRRFRSTSRSRVSSKSPLRKQPESYFKTESVSETKTKSPLKQELEMPQNADDEEKPKPSSENKTEPTVQPSSSRATSRSHSKPRFHVRSNSATAPDSGAEVKLESQSKTKPNNQARCRSASPSMNRYKSQKEISNPVKPSSSERSEIHAESPFKMQQDALSQVVSESKPRGRSRSRYEMPPKGRFQNRSSSPFQKQPESSEESKVVADSNNSRGRSRSRYEIPSKNRFQYRSASPFQKQVKKNTKDQIESSNESSGSRLNTVSPTPSKKFSKERPSENPIDKVNKRYGMPPSKSRFQVRSQSPIVKRVNSTSSASDATSSKAEPLSKDKLTTRARSASPANVTECLTMSTCDSLDTNSVSVNRVPQANVSTRGRSTSRSRAEILQRNPNRSQSKPRNESLNIVQDFNPVLIDLD